MLALLLAACTSGTAIVDQPYTVGCGLCMFATPSTGCYWAAKVDGKVLGIGGPGVPTEAELPSHEPGGMCTMERTARITGTLYEDKIIADRFVLDPVDPAGSSGGGLHDHQH